MNGMALLRWAVSAAMTCFLSAARFLAAVGVAPSPSHARRTRRGTGTRRIEGRLDIAHLRGIGRRDAGARIGQATLGQPQERLDVGDLIREGGQLLGELLQLARIAALAARAQVHNVHGGHQPWHVELLRVVGMAHQLAEVAVDAKRSIVASMSAMFRLLRMPQAVLKSPWRSEGALGVDGRNDLAGGSRWTKRFPP